MDSLIISISLIALGVVIVTILIMFINYIFPSIIIYRFSREDCPYCINSKAEWRSFKNRHLLDYRVKFVEINLTKQRPNDLELAVKYDVQTVPKMIMVNLGNSKLIYTYEGDNTTDDMCKWYTNVKKHQTRMCTKKLVVNY